METNNIISVQRLWQLLRRQIFSNGKSMLIAFAGVSGVLLFITLLVAYFNPGALNALRNLYFTAMFIGGYIYTSNIYGELHEIHRSYSYLTLPVSTTERLLSGWILTGILFPLATLIAIAIVVLLSNMIMALIVTPAPVQTMFYSGSLSTVKVYMITQTIFLLGAAYFRKNNFLKTILALFLFNVAFNIYVSLLGWGLFGSFMGHEGGMIINENSFGQSFEQLFTVHFPAIFRFIFHWLLGPFFLITTWFSLKERQV